MNQCTHKHLHTLTFQHKRTQDSACPIAVGQVTSSQIEWFLDFLTFLCCYYSEEEVLQDNINDLNTDITIKQKLIDELEHSQQRLTALKHQYDQKLNLLHNKIKETEDERDKVDF